MQYDFLLYLSRPQSIMRVMLYKFFTSVHPRHSFSVKSGDTDWLNIKGSKQQEQKLEPCRRICTTWENSLFLLNFLLFPEVLWFIHFLGSHSCLSLQWLKLDVWGFMKSWLKSDKQVVFIGWWGQLFIRVLVYWQIMLIGVFQSPK